MSLRWDSPLVLAIAGTLAIHTLFGVAADAIVTTHPLRLDPLVPPHVKLVDVTVVPHPPVPHVDPPPRPVTMPPNVTPPVAAVRPAAARVAHVHAAPAPEAEEAKAGAAGGAAAAGAAAKEGDDGPVQDMPDLGAPAATGTATGTGSGSGSGSREGTGTGSGDGVVSVAAIKTPAMPRGDYSYYESKDYPVEAKQLGIEGTIRVKLVVDRRGKVTSATLLDHLGHGLDELALARARGIEFTPARSTDDRDVASVVIWTFHMTLPR